MAEATKIATVIGKAHREIQRIEQDDITIIPGYKYNYLEILRKIDLYFASRFVKGNYDAENFKKLFVNIGKYRVNTATKSVNLGTKDVRVTAEDGQSYYPAWFFEQELKQFMKENGWGEIFNEMCSRLPRYGTIVVKDVNGTPYLMVLRNLIWDPGQPDIKKSTFIDEKHLSDLDAFWVEGKKNGWNFVDEVIKMYEAKQVFEVQYIERYGFVPGDELTDKVQAPDEYVKARSIIAGLEFYDDEVDAANQNNKTAKPTLLESIKVDEPPYDALHWEKEDGRNLGVGVMEDLFSNQEYWNDVTHLERKSLHWSSKKFFQTRDQEAPSNLYTEAHNGEVFSVRNEISAIAMEERNLPQYNLVYNRIKENSDQRAFSYEVSTGEGLPSGTPFRLGALLSNAVNSHYAFKRENLGLFIEKIIWNFTVPEFKKRMRKEHTFNFDGTPDQITVISEFLINAHMDKAIKDFEKQNGRSPTVAEFDREYAKVKDKVSKRDTLHLTLPEGFYDNIKIKTKVDVSGDSTNSIDMETLGNIFEIVAKNPAVTGNPTAMHLLEIISNQAGQNPKRLFGLGGKAQGQPVAASPAGGGIPNVPAPTPNTPPGGGL